MENPGDEGNLVQEAEILKAFSIVAGVRCEGRRLTLMPRLPWLWDTMECVDWPVTDADGRTHPKGYETELIGNASWIWVRGIKGDKRTITVEL